MTDSDDLAARRAKLTGVKRALLEKRLRGEPVGGMAGYVISPRSEAGPASLSFAQQRLWFLERLMPGMDAYHLPAPQRLKGHLNIPALEAAINEIIRRHEVLRTTFESIEGRPVQTVAPSLLVPLRVCDASEVQDQSAFLNGHASEMNRPFDLACGPLLRCQLIRFGPEDHVFLLVMHHIITDGWSMGVFFRELAILYHAFAAGLPSPLAELPVQYADFAVWQRQRAGGEEFQKQLDYWVHRLRDVAPLDLPADRPRPPVQSFRGGRDFMALPPELAEGLRASAQAGEATLYMILLAAFQILLFRYTGREDLTVGTPSAGRNYSELEGLIGFFVNTLVLRSDLSGDPQYTEVLRRVRTMALEAYRNQAVPFELLVETLQSRRDLSRTPLFQVFFNMVSYVDDPMDLPGLQVEPLAPPQTPSKFDLTLYAGETRSGITLSLVYNADLFEPERMAELLRQYQNLLWQVVEKPNERISCYSLMTRAATSILPSPYLPLARVWEGTLHDRVAAHARSAPDSLAIHDRHASWSYRELDHMSSRIADMLRTHGVEKGNTVAVYADRSAGLVCALLAVLKAGAAFIVLDSGYPAVELIERIRASHPVAWVQVAGTVPDALRYFTAGIPMRCRLAIPLGSEDRAAFISISTATRLPQADIQFEDAAYVAFTSGTTGNSKAVLGTHGPLSHFLRWHTETFGFGPGDRFSMLSGLSHDPLLRDIFTPLWSGGAVLVPEPEDMAMPGGLAAWLRRERITVAHLTPAMSGLLQTGGDEGSLPDLRYAFFGADILTERDVAQICRRAPQATVVNFYGTTETPQAMSYWVMPPIPARAGDEGTGRIPLGRGIEGAQLLVLNRARSLAGIGELGEIHIRSPYLAAGYLDDDALQQDRFLPNPMTASQSDRMYRTGDLGCYRPDGAVEFAARADDQVKIRGYRVEPGQVEAALCRHPGLRQCHVAAQRGPDGNSRLIGYVVPADGAIPTSGELYEFLRERLPDYMVPSAFVLLPALPLTPNGKLDRRTLPQPELAIFAPTRGPATPLAGMEEALAGMWTDLLGVSGVGPDDNFFASGGHSLLATQLLWRIRQRFEVDLPVRRVFEHPTPAGLAEAIGQARRDGEKQSVPALERAARVPQRDGPT